MVNIESVLKFTKFAYAITFNNTQQCQFINIDFFPLGHNVTKM